MTVAFTPEQLARVQAIFDATDGDSTSRHAFMVMMAELLAVVEELARELALTGYGGRPFSRTTYCVEISKLIDAVDGARQSVSCRNKLLPVNPNG